MNYFQHFYVLILFYSLASCQIHQTEIHNNVNLETSYENLADDYFFSNNLDSALYYYQTIINFPNVFSARKARSYIKIGSIFFSLNNINSAIQNLKIGLNIYNNNDIEITKVDHDYIFSGTLLIANCYRLSGNFQIALMFLADLEKSISKSNPTYNCKQKLEMLSEINSWKALVCFDFGLINKSISHNIKAIDIVEKNELSDCLVYNNYSYLGRIFMNEGDLFKSEQYFNQAKKIIVKCYGRNSHQYAELMSEFGLLYLEFEKYNEAIYCFNISREVSQINRTRSEIELAYTYNNLGDAFCGLAQFERAISYYHQAKDIFLHNKYYKQASILNHNLGIANYSVGNFDIAKDYYNAALILSSKENLPDNIYTAYTHQRLGQLYYTQNEYLKATFHYDQAISIIHKQTEDSISISEPIIQSNFLSRFEFLKSQYLKGKSEFQYYSNTKQKEYLLNSINSFRKALLMSDVLRQHYNFFKTKLSLNKTYIPLLNNYLEALLNLNKTAPSQKNDNYILEAIDRSQYMILRSLIKMSNINSYFFMSSNSHACFDSLLKTIIFQESKAFNTIDKHRIDENLQITENQLFRTTFSFDTLLHSLGEKYPAFQKHLCKYSTYKIPDIQSLLPDSACIIQYYSFGENLIAVAINKTNHIISEMKYDSAQIYHQKEKLLQSIVFSDQENLLQISNTFYDLLITPIESLISDCNKLIIIPDMTFTGIPFEIFSQKKSLDLDHMDNNPEYLVSRYDISYQYSLNLWGDKSLEKKSNNYNWDFEFAGFAPLFGVQYSRFNLSFSKNEIRNISKIFDGSGKTSIIYIDSCIAENTIIDELLRSKIVHIASHGVEIKYSKEYYITINKNGIDSAFSGTTYEDGRLQISEIFLAPIRSELVTLSVCSSGLGIAKTGEGNVSFAYGLYFAGARNILYTIYDVSDFHSQIFMSTFYQYINDGLGYSKALQKTKLDFINSKYNLPVFWSGYMING